MLSEVGDEIIYPFPNVNGSTVEILGMGISTHTL